MHARLILTLALVFVAAVATAAAVLFLFHAQPPAAPAGPTLTITGDPIIDGSTGQTLPADVYANSALLYQHVISFQITVPLTATTELAVAAPGYNPWSLRFRAGAPPVETFTGPIRLQPRD